MVELNKDDLIQEVIVNQTIDSNNKETIHIRYMKLCQINLKAKDNIMNLKKMRDQDKITEGRYKTLIEENEKKLIRLNHK